MSRGKRKLIHPIVKVFWGDASTDHGWRHISDLSHEAMDSITVGYLIKSDRVGVTIAAMLNAALDCSARHFIPRGMITKVEVLRK